MSNRIRLLVLLAFSFIAPVNADDKPAAKPTDVRKAALLKAGYTAVPLSDGPKRDLKFYVDGIVGAEKVRFLLDSGDMDSAEIELAVAKRLKLMLGEEVAGLGAGGKHIGRQVEFPSLTLGSFDAFKDWHRFGGVASDLTQSSNSPTGILGVAALDEWAAVVDYPNRTLYLRPYIATVWPRLAGKWTVASWQEEGQARKLDPKAPAAFEFVDRRFKLTDGGKTREYGIRLVPNDFEGASQVRLFDPKQERKPAPVTLASGVIKVKGDTMTACLALDAKKSKEPPMDFDAPKGSGYVLLELKRSNPVAPKIADPLREILVKAGYTAVPMEHDAAGLRVVKARLGRHMLRLVVDTGANISVFDTAGLSKWGAVWLGRVEGKSLGGSLQVEGVCLRGLTLGAYDTRRVLSGVYGGGIDLSQINKAMTQEKLQPIQGLLGNLDLLTNSAVIDFGTNTLYLRPFKETLWPQLEGKWVGVRYESGGRKGQYKPGDAAVEFKNGRIRFATKDGAADWAFHLRHEGDRYWVELFDPDADELADGFSCPTNGAMRLNNGTLTLVMERGKSRREPTEFAAPAGSGLLLVEYERAIDAAKLVGTWKWVVRKGADPSEIVFRKDGTVTITIMSKDVELALVGKYKVEGKKVVMIGEGRNYVYSVNKLTESELEWTPEEGMVTESYSRVQEK